ncbi:hypothetical protein LUZ63_009282 [Rhynchospora breviuscula]|uniref:Reverse transcriptase domain-containing protein n=1 Tax=Rhynchospora breviuscula TaxID=2022672 RepID=A0A9Q0CFJ7_9POAL|nr:hypothetical protein LUZ63_009282 [Rhynchospora breviuscula]
MQERPEARGPLSSYLFILAAEGLTKILQKAAQNDHFHGLGPTLHNGSTIIHLQYTDDTRMSLNFDLSGLEKVSWALKAFEMISGLKINFSKTEIIPLNLTNSDLSSVLPLFNCKETKLPITYLGIPLHWKLPRKQGWSNLIDKISNKFSRWKSNFLSMGGRSVILNSVLIASPLYYFSIFKCPSWALNKIERIRRNFLWGSYQSADKKKLCLVNWQTICKRKEFGGWGIINLQHMNLALLCKWAWKYFYKEHNSLWEDLVRSRYKNLNNTHSASSLWKSFSKLLPIFKIGSQKIVGNGKDINF